MKAKKLLSMVLASAMTLTMAVTAVTADDSITVLLDSKELTFDVPPMIVEGRTLVPFRKIFEALGYEVDWNGDTQTVTGVKGDIGVKMVIGKTEAELSNNAADASEPIKNVTFEVPPQIVEGRTLVPVRAVAEMSGYKVDWIGDTRTVTIDSPVDIMTGPGPAMPEATENPATQTGPGPASPSNQYEIEYDPSREMLEGYMKNFEFKSITKNDEGKYVIEYTLNTFIEGHGSVAVKFNCLNAAGNVVDTWERVYNTVDYTFTPQEDTVTVSGDTVKIELVIAD